MFNGRGFGVEIRAKHVHKLDLGFSLFNLLSEEENKLHLRWVYLEHVQPQLFKPLLIVC